MCTWFTILDAIDNADMQLLNECLETHPSSVWSKLVMYGAGKIGDVAIIDRLIEFRAKRGATDGGRGAWSEALRGAVREGNTALAKLCLKNGAKITHDTHEQYKYCDAEKKSKELAELIGWKK